MRWILILMMLCGVASAEEIAVCRSPVGKAFFHYTGTVDQKSAGWVDDGIKDSVFTLSQLQDGTFDVLFMDARKKPMSSRQDGAQVIFLRGGSGSVSVLTSYPESLTEIYTFFRDKAGKAQFTIVSSRSVSGFVDKSSVMVGACETLRIDLLRATR